MTLTAWLLAFASGTVWARPREAPEPDAKDREIAALRTQIERLKANQRELHQTIAIEREARIEVMNAERESRRDLARRHEMAMFLITSNALTPPHQQQAQLAQEIMMQNPEWMNPFNAAQHRDLGAAYRCKCTPGRSDAFQLWQRMGDRS